MKNKPNVKEEMNFDKLVECYVNFHVGNLAFYKIKSCSSQTQLRKDAKMDRLSDLPTHIIHYIFGFLDSSYVVQASVLSKRWIRHVTNVKDELQKKGMMDA
ncbi:hypothetical protein Scep_023361 [Stephania cephalantha]|uniref:F-box domain-containing protein n=1 Tax=Stephania cephalantha TaxID=152367 RepID=A0AAP0HX81_9MAGN